MHKLSDAHSEGVISMSADLQNFFGITHTAFVIQQPTDSQIGWLKEGLPDSGNVVIGRNDPEVEKALKYCDIGQSLLVFLDSMSASVGLKLFESRLHLSSVYLAPIETPLTKLKLRLDSQLYLFERVQEEILLHEVYAVKSGPQISKMLGSWTPKGGLDIPQPGIWQRRSNLMGAEIRNGLMSWSVFNRLTLDAEERILANRGIFAGVVGRLGIILLPAIIYNFSTVSSLQSYYWQPKGLLTQC